MKDRTLTRAQRRMPLMHQPLLSDREVALLFAAARFLYNAAGWRGETVKALKDEIREALGVER